MTVCGHNHETLRWALEHEKRCGGLGGFDAVARGNDSAAAWRAIQDHAKLAAIVAELLSPIAPKIHVFVSFDGERIIVANALGHGPRLTMPQARVFTRALLDAPQATAQDIERMIGELS